MLKINNLHVFVENKHIVKGVTLVVKPGEVHAVMGPNGSGKSSLAYALMGHPSYEVKSQKSKVKSQLLLREQNLLSASPEERARKGLFLAFQHPVSIPGVNVVNFLRLAKQSLSSQVEKKLKRGEEIKSITVFKQQLKRKAQSLGIDEEFLNRELNQGFSGGEKKRIEMLQLAILEPHFAIIDEIDTGLDIDALKLVARGIKDVVKENKTGVLLITHYQRILHYLKPDFVHIMIDGRIVATGDASLAERVEKDGYRNFYVTGLPTITNTR